jgi:hypothetical protein
LSLPGPLDLYKDLAVAQTGAQSDPNASEADVARNMRRRIAALLCIPGMAGALSLWAWSGWNLAVAIAAFGLLLVILWLYAERPARE